MFMLWRKLGAIRMRFLYSMRSATIGSTRMARPSGTKPVATDADSKATVIGEA